MQRMHEKEHLDRVQFEGASARWTCYEGALQENETHDGHARGTLWTCPSTDGAGELAA